MNEEQNTRLVQQAYDKFKAGDIAGLMEMMADDIEWELDKTESVPFSGQRHGKAEVANFFQQINELQHPLQFEPREFIAQGDRVVALGHYTWSVKPTDRIYDSDFAEVFTVRDGKIAGFREFANTAAGETAFRPS